MPPIKHFLYGWLVKNRNVSPIYEVVESGTRTRRLFDCSLRVPTFDYVATGRSSSKKNSMESASRDFCEYLIRENAMDSKLFSSIDNMFDESSASVIKTVNGKSSNELIKPESQDGIWTLSNAKCRLSKYLQSRTTEPQSDYHFTETVVNNQPIFTSEMTVFVHEIGQEIRAKKTGPSKKEASKAVALSLLRQLYFLGVISGSEDKMKTKSKPVSSDAKTFLNTCCCPCHKTQEAKETRKRRFTA
ncbi:hypothetical protein ACOME3_000282 [Neoechinorhynchus agilis]